jgi:hypothetical protein
MKRALVLSLICVLGLAFSGLAATLSGSWDTDVTIDLTQTAFSSAISLSSELIVNYIVGDWTFTSTTALGDSGWTDQDFDATGVLGAFTISTSFDLNPQGIVYFVPVLPDTMLGIYDPMQFMGNSNLNAQVSIAGVSFELDVNLKRSSTWDPGLDLFVDFTASGVAGDVSIDVTVSFGDDESYKVITLDPLSVVYNGMPGVCDLDWAGLDITIGFPFDCVDLELEVTFDCLGFDEAVFSFGGIVVPNLPWLTIDGELTFDLVSGKTFYLTPTFDFGAIVCFDLYWGIDGWSLNGAGDQGFSLDSIYLDGIGLSVDFGGVTFEAISYWGPGDDDGDYPGLLNDYGHEYWEAYKISTTDDACCGPFSFSFAVFFDDEADVIDTNLFDIDLFVATVELEVASQFTFDMGLTVDVDGGFTEWTVGFAVTW